ncbi:MAG TPA: HAD-IIB family hydrolase [Burkholderiaceae bacterium]|nr:HAD-IIB family hydrolase [Burkholderiaceae bacterium]
MTTTRPLPLTDLPPELARRVRGVFTDIDDTLTSDGAITADALAALQRLHEAGVHVIAITGRPMGWSAPFAKVWPLDAIVAENGAVALIHREDRGGDGGEVRIEYAQDEPTRLRNAHRLADVARRVLHEVEGSTLARDSAGRVTDIAIDHAEFTQLPPPRIAQVVELMRASGMNATVSSIHINGWFGAHTKLSGARWMVERLYGRALDAELERWVYVGDSTNDQQMFGHFPLSIGVANLLDFEAQLTTWPRYLTRHPRGRGFAEVAEALLTVRERG